MRNGNSGQTEFQKGDVIGSYRTYEEWKLQSGQLETALQLCSYRTYEEWKLSVFFTLLRLDNEGSYRTYEEWKLLRSLACKLQR